MRDCADVEILPGQIISYAQRAGNSGHLTLAHVLSTEGDKLKVEIPTDDFHVYWKNDDYKQGSLGTRRRSFAKKVTFQYPHRATVLPHITYKWWVEKYKIGVTEYSRDTGKPWPNQSEPVESEAEIHGS